MLFDLEEAIMFTPKPQEYTDPLTGEMKKKQMKFFPDAYKNRIGKSYNDYIADHQMNMFEDFIGYQSSTVLDEPEREAGTTSIPIPQREESVIRFLVKLKSATVTRKILQSSNLLNARNIRKLPGKTAKRNVQLCVKRLKLIHRRQQSTKPSCRKAVNDAASMPKIKSWLNRSLLIQSLFNLNRLLKRLKK